MNKHDKRSETASRHVGAAEISRTAEEERVWQALSEISDPEIPVLSLVDMKIIRSVKVEEDAVIVELTPTFSGCPALEMMQQQVRERLVALGFRNVQVDIVRSSDWSTEMLDEAAREKLRRFGIAPPAHKLTDLRTTLNQPVACPYCGSLETHLESPFGPTLCRQIYYCDSCSQSFERFKPL